MDIEFNCPTCSQHLVADASGIGSIIECPKCQSSVLIPPKSEPIQTPKPPEPTQPPKQPAPLMFPNPAKPPKPRVVPVPPNEFHSATKAQILTTPAPQPPNRYSTLRSIASVLTVCAALLIIWGVLVILQTVLNNLAGGSFLGVGVGFGIIVLGIGVVASGELIRLLIDIEANTGQIAQNGK